MSHPLSVQLGDWTLSYSVHGSGPALILLHGGSPGASGASYYAHNIQALAANFTTYVIDFPGWGSSSKNLLPIDGWRNPLEAAGEVISGFIAALGLEQPHLLGSSFGAAAALYHAMNHPDAVGKLVLVSPGGGRNGNIPFTPAVMKLVGYYMGEGPTLAKLTDMASSLTYRSDVFSPDELRARFESSCDPATVANPPLRLPPNLSSPAALCDDPRLAELRADVLFVWGRQDQVQPLGCLASFAAIPEQDQVIFNRCGHLPSSEYPQRFNQLVSDFLQQP